MYLSQRTKWAIDQMRECQKLEEEKRKAASVRYAEAKEDLTRAYTNTQRQTLGNFDSVIDRRATGDQLRRDLIGDEQLYRGLTSMYANIAKVELSLDEAREREQSAISHGRTKRQDQD